MHIFVKRLAVLVLVALLAVAAVVDDICPCGISHTDKYWDESGIAVNEVICQCDQVINA